MGLVLLRPTVRVCAIVPAFDAASTVGEVVRSLRACWPEPDAVIVVDDGSGDATGRIASEAGAVVLCHPDNRGKGAALCTAMRHALDAGFDFAVTVDADGQHPAAEALRLLHAPAEPRALVLGVRDLAGAGAPKKNRASNAISNFFLSLFSGQRLADTQCGLRRYPIATTLALGAGGQGYAFEAEVLLRAIRARVPVVEVPIEVVYPPGRVTHFHSVRDPARIVARVVATMLGPRPVVPSPDRDGAALEPARSSAAPSGEGRASRPSSDATTPPEAAPPAGPP